jgi:uncharacterized membrane protein YozB (DUF420 family)
VIVVPITVIVLAVASLIVVSFYPAGLVAIESRDIKNHQFRMVSATIALSVICLIYGLNFLFAFYSYKGLYRDAYWLLTWLTFGLGISGLSLSLLAIWSMYEAAWDLHRRAGMFGMLSGTVSGLACFIRLIMYILS